MRVGLETKAMFAFSAKDSFWVFVGNQGVFKGEPGTWKLRLKNGKPAVFSYWMMVWRGSDSAAASDTLRKLVSAGYAGAGIMSMGKIFVFPHDTVDMRDFAVLVGPYSSEKQALRKGPKPAQAVIKLLEKPSSGTVELVAPDGSVPVRAQGALRVSSSQPIITLKHQYPDILEFRVSSDGKGLTAINEVQLENYIKGVLPYEMGPNFPVEALKAQAVLARCHVFFVWGKKFKLTAEPYDFTDDVFTQVYNGVGQVSPAVDSAAAATKGCVMVYRDKIIKAPFHASCGGYLESSQTIWNEDIPGTGAWSDSPQELCPASTEEDIKNFIDNPPDVWCNPKTHEFPVGFLWARSYFRWKVSKTGPQWAKVIAKNHGKNPGSVKAFQVVSRGPGGRVVALKVVGTKKSFVIKGEYNIRKALGGLKSTLFYISRSGKKIVVKGGGFGHGSGMCQIGAGVMANEGHNYMEILSHYFHGLLIKKMY